jgi:flagellar motility protein MotE (MotC chaperone)
MKRMRPGALALLAGILAVVAAGKAVEVAAVVADSAAEAEPAAVRAATPEPAPAKEAHAECSSPAVTDDAFGRALAERAEALDRKEARLEQLRQELKAALTALQQERAKLAEARRVEDTAADVQLQRLVALYETMKPKAAAAIFQEMNVDVAARLLAKIQQEQASFILSSMEPRRAYALTVALSNELVARMGESGLGTGGTAR